MQPCIVQRKGPFHCKRQDGIIAVAKFMHLHNPDFVIRQKINLFLCILHNFLKIMHLRIFHSLRKFIHQLPRVPWIVQLIGI